MQKHLVFVVATIFVTLLLWLSTAPLLSWYEYNGFEQDLLEASRKWQESGIANYEMVFETTAPNTPFHGPVRVQFHDSELLNAYLVDTGKIIDNESIRRFPYSVESFHRLVHSIIQERPYKFQVEYDSILGYPTLIAVSYSDFSHDGFGYFVTWFEKGANGA